MRRADQEAIVVRLACEVEDRAADEQRALLAMALRIDLERGRFTVSNREPVAPCLFVEVVGTYKPEGGRRVRPSGDQLRKIQELQERWLTCERCGRPIGAHGPDGCA